MSLKKQQEIEKKKLGSSILLAKKKKKYCLHSYKRPDLATIHEKKDLGISFVTSSKWVSLNSVAGKKSQ